LEPYGRKEYIEVDGDHAEFITDGFIAIMTRENISGTR
jgi:hypothetical protein